MITKWYQGNIMLKTLEISGRTSSYSTLVQKAYAGMDHCFPPFFGLIQVSLKNKEVIASSPSIKKYPIS